MKGHARTTFAATLAILAAVALAGCSLLSPALFAPARGDDGQVLEPATINSADLLVGDCFTFVDNTNLAKSVVGPCSDGHTYIVIDQGVLDAATVDSAGGLQNAVNAACDDPFAEFKAAAPEGVKPEQQFIVSDTEVDGEKLTKYSCVATDASS